jgi:hypothetical protein
MTSTSENAQTRRSGVSESASENTQQVRGPRRRGRHPTRGQRTLIRTALILNSKLDSNARNEFLDLVFTPATADDHTPR